METERSWTSILAHLGSDTHLTRERALRDLKAACEKDGYKEVQLTTLVSRCDDPSAVWEVKQGCLRGAALLLQYRDGCLDARDHTEDKLLCVALSHLEDNEVRVRQAVAEVLGALSARGGLPVYCKVRDTLLRSIKDNFERKEEEEEEEEAGSSGSGKTSKNTQLKHDTEGWRFLETSLKCFQMVVNGCGTPVVSLIVEEKDLTSLLAEGVSHTNRFVREITFETYSAICAVANAGHLRSIEKLQVYLAQGLEDNWSQVRYAASIATRSFLSRFSRDARKQFYTLLLPRMCLNRHYVAKGVQIYSLESWKDIVGMEGKSLLAQYIDDVVQYYVKASQADNHAVREAACHCITELATKIDAEAVKPHVDSMLATLLMCFRDESWPVRDAACTATGDFVACFPEQSKPHLEELYQLWFKHLTDNIWSVRENSACAIGKVVEALGDEAFERAFAVLKENLPKVKEQPEDAPETKGNRRYMAMENTTTFGVAKAIAHDPKHCNQQLYSCGSLAPKLKRGTGCMDHGFSRAVEPWECSDGAVYLLRQLARIRPKETSACFSTLVEIAKLPDPFKNYYMLLETIWKQVPAIATTAKGYFYPYVDTLIPPLLRTMSHENQLARASAAQAATKLAKMFPEEFESLPSSIRERIRTSGNSWG